MDLKECFPANYVIIDTETSGLDPKNDRILEVAVLKVKERKAKELRSWLLNPAFPNIFEVPKKITEITGITKEQLIQHGKRPGPALTTIRETVGNSLIYAHNGIRFDRLFLNAEFKRVDLKPFLDSQYLDSAAIFKAWRMDLLEHLNRGSFFEFANRILEKRAYGVYFNLKFCCETLNIDISDLQAHRAAADVVMTYRIIEALRGLLIKDD